MLVVGLNGYAMREEDENPAIFFSGTGYPNGLEDPEVAREDPVAPESAGHSVDAGAEAVAAAEAQTGADAPRTFHLLTAWGRFARAVDAGPGVPITSAVTTDTGALVVTRLLTLDSEASVGITRGTDPLRALEVDVDAPGGLGGAFLRVVLHPDLHTGSGDAREGVLSLSSDVNGTPDDVELPLNASALLVDHLGAPVADRSVMVRGFQQRGDDADCVQGFMVGHWGVRAISSDGRRLGRFVGRYLAADGTRLGLVRGIWGEMRDGSRPFYAKVVAPDGMYLALMAGTFDNAGFTGQLHRTRTTVMGAVAGRRAFTAEAGENLGRFVGRWSQLCGEVTGEQ
ncbi:MAG: hypothetical protein AB2A00_23625 [Myxococcota bacterium]